MFSLKLVFGVIFPVVFYVLLLFLPAGTVHWWRGWVVVGVVLVMGTATMLAVFSGNEGLLNERYKPPLQKGQPLADKILTLLLVATYFLQLVFIPLDVFRFKLLGGPGLLVSSAGLILFVVGWWLMALSLKQNTFAAPVVKYQEERKQTVIDSGPYAVVRHPMYAGGALLMAGMPLWLESYAGALLAGAPIAVLAARIVIEERLLSSELAGYDAYVRRVRYRLIPLLW
ncbi:MAG TPA: isoprenylcysteine carboxylmethyltransferase family protein [Candidatus Binataceae bacterium]|jgi:protein-S-isoprenylcysteine O-methyltransferase Ste14|nr:isoprenylcysteine carboxylmethyltransferase family protein [Candidatus Binataceae bacterium]